MDTQTQTAATPVPKIHAAIVAVMEEIGSIEKTRQNTQQNFKFRGVGDAMAACQPLFVKHKMYVRPLVVRVDDTKANLDKDGKPRGIHSRQTIVYRATSAEDGSFVDSEATGEAIDFGDKCAGKVMSVSFKFLIFQMFCIPDHNPEIDPDAHTPQNGSGNEPTHHQSTSPKVSDKKPQGSQAASGAADEKIKALKDLVALLERKGFKGKKTLEWLSSRSAPKRELKRVSEINQEEFIAMKKAAEALPDANSDVKE
jgi:hypothetical protein